MAETFEELKQQVLRILDNLENTVYAAAKEVRELKRPNSEAYADAILNQGNNELTTARVPCSDYEAWRDEIRGVQKVVIMHDGDIMIGQQGLDNYIQHITISGNKPTGTVEVTISIPGQEKHRDLKSCLNE